MFVREPRVVWRRTLRGIVALPPGSHDPNVLAPPGDAVWDGLATPTTADELIRGLAVDFGVDAVMIADDVHAMLGELSQAGLVVSSEPS